MLNEGFVMCQPHPGDSQITPALKVPQLSKGDRQENQAQVC